MYTLSLLSLAGLVAVSLAASIEPAPLSDAHINYINSIPGITWKAGRNFGPNDMPYVEQLLGVDMEANDRYHKLHMKMPKPQPFIQTNGKMPKPQPFIQINGDLPKEFDGRQKWPDCDSFKEIRDQSACGSCWAVAPAAAISDRICVATKKNVHISAEDINSCCTLGADGCRGGVPAAAWGFFVDEGVVTGGQFNSSQGCRPYSLQPCEHLGTGPLPSCDELNFTTPTCQRTCLEDYPKTYKEDKIKGTRTYTVEGVEDIMQEIFTKGSVTAVFYQYPDFLTYKSGVYKNTGGTPVGGHAVKILGWGVENGVDYWLVANSWNTHWGDKGFFKIAKGTNECGIEDFIVAGDP